MSPGAPRVASGHETTHRLQAGDARELAGLPAAAVDLIVTSPPYPMVEMWDEVFRRLSPTAGAALERGDGWGAFAAMHAELDRAWEACHRVLREGGVVCINVGDAVRTLGGSFALYPNHARILLALRRLGFTPLPDILWRKPTNSPTKFLGSGMLPPGAYVTYEHEYILVARKGEKRPFVDAAARRRRRESAFFWEERNVWFSDVWQDLAGTRQELEGGGARARSGAFPFALVYRLVSMFSVLGDTVLDPFAGTGTTAAAALAAGRSSVCVELDPALAPAWEEAVRTGLGRGREEARRRLEAHRSFVRARRAAGRPLKHRNAFLGLPVVTAQETELRLYEPEAVVERRPGFVRVRHRPASPLPEQPELFG